MRSTGSSSAAFAALASCVLACALRAPLVHAQDTGTARTPGTGAVSAPATSGYEERFWVRLGYGVTWDDNVFRLPDNAPDPELDRGNAGKSDRFSTASIAAHLNLPLSQQRFIFDASRAAIRYEKFGSRDQDPFSYRGAWQWYLTPQLTGVLSASRAETRVDVEDVEGRRKIDQSVTVYSGNADWWVTGGWHVLGGARETETTYSEPFLARPNTTDRATEVGLRYIMRSNSQVSVIQRHIRGTETLTDQAVLGGSEFTQDETELNGTWIASANSTLDGRVVRMKRRNELLPQRDFSATAGDLKYALRVTARVTTDLLAARKVEPYNLTLQSTTRVDDTLAAAVTWTTTERIALQARLSRQTTRYGQVSTDFEARRDTTDAVEVGASWAPYRYATLSVRARREKRDSTDATQVFDSNVATVNLDLRF